MKKKSLMIAACTGALAVFALTGCSGSGASTDTDAKNSDTSSSENTTQSAAADADSNLSDTRTTAPTEGYEDLGGCLWAVDAVYNRERGMTVYLSENERLSDLYDSTYLSFAEDGTFQYMNLYIYEGTYEKYDKGDEDGDYYLLKTEDVLKFDSDEGAYVSLDPDSYTARSYLLTVQDSNTIRFCEMDAFTGNENADDNPLLFAKSSMSSDFIANVKENLGDYIAENKTELEAEIESEKAAQAAAADSDKASADSGSTSAHSKSDGSSGKKSGSSYQAILDDYTEKMEDAVPGLVDEYHSESAGVSDIEELAEICNDKVSDLAEICNEGISEMASLMYKKDDSYSTYEDWAGKLMDNYTEIADEIMDAYLDSSASMY